jgi:hypothetical protein
MAAAAGVIETNNVRVAGLAWERMTPGVGRAVGSRTSPCCMS